MRQEITVRVSFKVSFRLMERATVKIRVQIIIVMRNSVTISSYWFPDLVLSNIPSSNGKSMFELPRLTIFRPVLFNADILKTYKIRRLCMDMQKSCYQK